METRHCILARHRFSVQAKERSCHSTVTHREEEELNWVNDNDRSRAIACLQTGGRYLPVEIEAVVVLRESLVINFALELGLEGKMWVSILADTLITNDDGSQLENTLTSRGFQFRPHSECSAFQR